MTTLGHVCLVNPRSFVEPVGDDWPVSFVPMAAVEVRTGRIDLSQVRTYADVSKGYTRFSEGDVLFAKITPCMENGKIAIAKGLTNASGCGSTEFHVLRTEGGLSREYLMSFLLQDDFRKRAQRSMSGTAGQLRVPAAFLADAPFPLAPLPEQHRIVAEIEKQFTRLDASVESLKRAQANLKRCRASVLKSACEGSLVPTEAELARAEGRDYEPAGVLLERILAERRARWEAQPKRKGKYKEANSIGIFKFADFPEGWTRTTIGRCFDVYVGATPSRKRPDFWNGVVRWVSSGEVAFNRINETRECITEEGVKNSSVNLHPPGTVLLGMIGEGKTRGQVSILDVPACNSQNSAAIRVSEVGLVPEYVFYYLWSQYGATRLIGSGNNQPALNKSRVQEIPLPLPPLAEQNRIVAEVERRLSVIQQAEATVAANLKRAERLRQSILKQAFSGQLVPQDPNDEPASVLLERIRAEREAAQATQAAAKPPRPPRRGKSKQPVETQLALPEEIA
jgi:type I restriction enzyme S subunit